MRRLEEMAENKEIWVTDLIGQSPPIRDAIGRILFNLVIDAETKLERGAYMHERTKPEVSNYPITIQCVEGRAETIEFRRSVMPHPDLVRKNIGSGTRLGDRAGLGSTTDEKGQHFADTQPINVDENVDYGKKKATMPLYEAWVVMVKMGAHCRPAPQLDKQMTYWRYEEVGHPANVKKDGGK
jgi:hypothetical protein